MLWGRDALRRGPELYFQPDKKPRATTVWWLNAGLIVSRDQLLDEAFITAVTIATTMPATMRMRPNGKT